MKEIKVEEAVGRTLCHDITQIVRGVTKGARFRKGHVIKEDDIPILLSLGKEHIFVWEDDNSLMHENDAADILRQICQNEGMTATEPKEGKIELKAMIDGVFHVDDERLDAVNDLDDMVIATIPNNMPVTAGTKLAGMRVVPLVIAREKMDEAKERAGHAPLLSLSPYKKMKVGVVTTGSEVFTGRIKDTFTPVIAAKLKRFGLDVDEHRLSDDKTEHTRAAIDELLSLGADMIICTGGMSVDPDDRTPAAIRDTGATIVTYGAPVLPGTMFMLAYYEADGKNVPILGLPGCVMYSPATIFDIVLARIVTGERLTRREIRRMGAGGLCMECEICRYPVCSFGK